MAALRDHGWVAGLLVVVSLVTGHHRNRLYFPFHYLWYNLCIVLSCCRRVNVKNGVGRSIDQERRLRLQDGEIRTLRAVG